MQIPLWAIVDSDGFAWVFGSDAGEIDFINCTHIDSQHGWIHAVDDI